MKVDGQIIFPSDNVAFPHSTVVCACKKVSGFGRCILPRRTKEVDEENIALLRDGLCKLVINYHPQKA